jgi:hypothetical protein
LNEEVLKIMHWGDAKAWREGDRRPSVEKLRLAMKSASAKSVVNAAEAKFDRYGRVSLSDADEAARKQAGSRRESIESNCTQSVS